MEHRKKLFRLSAKLRARGRMMPVRFRAESMIDRHATDATTSGRSHTVPADRR
jgi:hypothetical protein